MVDQQVVVADGRDAPALDDLLVFLREQRAFEFTDYQRGTLVRRIDHRLDQLGIRTYEDYADHLLLHPEEFADLFEALLINVTGFFRDETLWQRVGEDCVPALLQQVPEDAPLRVWVAGCSTGQEAYSAAMLLTDHLGRDQARARLKVYATDVDEGALEAARRGVYSALDVEALDEERRDRYFTKVNGGYAFDTDLRRRMIFGHHDLLKDPPISRIDLLLCRNVLMYFNAEAQARLVHRFHFALADHGYLVLGRAEMLLAHTELFRPLDTRVRIFVKQPDAGRRDRLVGMDAVRSGPEGSLSEPVPPATLAAAFEAAGRARLIVRDDGVLAAANRAARELFEIGRDALGSPFEDLAASYRPVELRSAIEEASASGRPVRRRGVAWPGSGRVFDVEVAALSAGAGATREPTGHLIAFDDVTAADRAAWELARSQQQLEAALEDLHSANEELETANDELQATIEELETTNEELRSTNEELEAMNEALSSTNEELSAINDELVGRGSQIDELNLSLISVLDVVSEAVVVVDRDLHVRAWNRCCVERWEVTAASAVGRPLVGLGVDLPLDEIVDHLRPIIAGSDPAAAFEVGGGPGGSPRYAVRCSPVSAGGAPSGAVVLIEPAG